MNRFNEGLARGAAALTAAVVVVLAPPDRDGWSRIWDAAHGRHPAPHLDATAVLVASTALWCLAAWVLVVLAAGGLARLPGAAGVVGRAVVRVCVPRVLRGVVVGSIAGGLLAGPAVAAGATPVWPTSPPASSSTTAGPTWPTATPPSTSPPTAPADPAPPSTPAPPPAPAPPTAPAPSPAPAPPTSEPTSVVVAPGDSLWSIARDALRADGGTPTDTGIAATWPTWYAANRAVIGPDPGLLHPGTPLTAPSATDGSTP